MAAAYRPHRAPSLSPAQGSQVSSPLVTLTNGSGNALTLSAGATSSPVNWLSFSAFSTNPVPAGGTTRFVCSTSNCSGLTSGLAYQGTITVTPSTGAALPIPVTFTAGGSGNGSWSATPNNVTWSYNTNSGSFLSQAISVSTSSGSTSYGVNSTSNGNSWLLASYNGSDSTSLSGIPIGSSFAVKVSTGLANALGTGQYTGTATITDPFGNTQGTVTVTLNVNGGSTPGLSINPNSVSLSAPVGGTTQSQLVTISSTSGGALSVTGNSSTPTWLTTSPGPLPGESVAEPAVPVQRACQSDQSDQPGRRHL